MPKVDYQRQMFKQIEELMNKCNDLSSEIKRIKYQNSNEIINLKKEHRKEIKKLNEKIIVLEEENNKLKKENQILREDNDRLKKIINNDSSNSSKPPSTDIKPNKKICNSREKSNKKSGGQNGHKAHNLSKSAVEEKIKNGELEHKVVKHGNEKEKYVTRYILDIQIGVVAEEHRFYPDENGKYNIPEEFKADVQYGTNLKTMCVSLNAEEYVALDRIKEFIANITSLKLTPSKGTIVNFIKECDEKSQNTIDKIKEKILNSPLMHTDATVSRCNNKNQSVRNYSTNEITLLVGTEGKSIKHIEETNILPIYTGALIHDHETAIYNYGGKHGECNVHILRYLKSCVETTNHKWANDLGNFLCCINNSKKELKSNGKNGFKEKQLERFSNRYDEIVQNGFEENKDLDSKYYKEDEKRLLRRLQKYKENHLLFACDFDIPFDNNLSERDLRHVKSKLKISGCFRNERGMQQYLNIRSIISTCKKMALNSYTALENIFKNIPVEI